jgi:1-phosphofructokinase/tagatose 6-phosphate kinase
MNAAMDRALVVPNFLQGRRHRASNTVTLPGGRGVTIARALRRLGSPVIATGMAGGLTGGNIVERLTDEAILNDFVRIMEPSRTSTAVIDPVTGIHTEINEHGPRVQGDEVELLVTKLRYLARASRMVVLAGTLPRDVDADIYQRLVRMLAGLNVLSVVTQPDDTAVLRAALAGEPALTIVDQREAEALVGHEFGSDEDFLLGLDEMARMGGAQTSIVVHECGCYARVRARRKVSYHKASHDPVESVSELGSTDVFVAGYIHALEAERPVAECLSAGLGAALANRRQLGAGLFDRGEAIRLQRDVTVSELEPVEVEHD